MNRLSPLLAPKDVILSSETLFLYCAPKSPTEDVPVIPGSILCSLARLPSLKHLKGLLVRLNAEGKKIVCYQHKGIDTAAQVWWLLLVLGVEDVQVLDGGLHAYKSTGQVIQVQPLSDPEISPIDAEIDRSRYKVDSEVQTVLRSSIHNFQVLDTEGSYNGAIHCPVSVVMSEDGGVGDVETVKLVLVGLGVKYEALATTIVLGPSAPQLLLVLSLLGMTHLCLGIVDRSHKDDFLDVPITDHSNPDLKSSMRTEFYSISGNTEFFDAMEEDTPGGPKTPVIRDSLVATRRPEGVREDRRGEEVRERKKKEEEVVETQHSCGGCQVC